MRMSIDSMLATDPRAKKLAMKTRLPFPHVVGSLLLVWEAAYNKRTAFMASDDVDVAAQVEGFADAMVAVGLAEAARAGDTMDVDVVIRKAAAGRPAEVATFALAAEGDGVRLRGIRDRIGFLLAQKDRSWLAVAARRRRAAESPEGLPAGSADRPEGSSTGLPSGSSTGLPAGSPYGLTHSPPDLDLDLDLARAPASAHAIRGAPLPTPVAVDETARARGRLADRIWDRMNQIRVELATERGWTDVFALSDQMRGHRDLRDRIRESGAAADQLCDHVLAVLEAEARRDGSVEWLSGKSFTEGGWQRAVAMRVADVARPRNGAAPPRPETRPLDED